MSERKLRVQDGPHKGMWFPSTSNGYILVDNEGTTARSMYYEAWGEWHYEGDIQKSDHH